MTAPPFEFRLGRDDRLPYLHVLVEGYAHPDIAEPAGLDLLACRLEAVASPVRAAFELAMRVDELLELRAYLSEINSGNGPAHTFAFAGGLFELGVRSEPPRPGAVRSPPQDDRRIASTTRISDHPRTRRDLRRNRTTRPDRSAHLAPRPSSFDCGFAALRMTRECASFDKLILRQAQDDKGVGVLRQAHPSTSSG